MYVFARSPKYVCPKCRNKITIEDMEAVFRFIREVCTWRGNVL